jgi:TetR/AcrR family transcriptional regulator, cholesterol catabolism regulator
MRKDTKVIKAEKDNRYTEIMRVAGKIIAQKGYRGTTIEDIATELGITPAAIYYYFKSKADLLYRIAADSPQPVDNILKISEYLISPRDQLRQIITWLIILSSQYPEFFSISSEIGRFYPKESSEIFLKREKEVEYVVQKVLKKGVEQGLFAIDDVQISSFALLGACSWVYRWYKPDGRLKPQEIAELFVSLLERGYLNTKTRFPGYVIYSGDETVYPLEVEEVLLKHPDIREALVIAVPDPYWIERIHALVILKEGARVSDAGLVSYCKTQLTPAKVPKSIEFLDSLPYNLPREELRAKLSEKYWKGLKRRN